MKQFSIACIVSIVTMCSLLAQKEVAVLKTEYKSRSYSSKESLAISNNRTGELIILVEDLDKTNLFLLDKNFEEKGKLTTPSLLSSFKTFLGYSISDTEDVTIFFSNKSKKKFGTLTFNFKKNNIDQKKLDLKFKKEKVIDGISHNNRFYFLTGATSSNFVNFYDYDDKSKSFEKHEVSFEEVTYRTVDGYVKKPLDMLRESKIGSSSGGLKKIDIKSPNAIETTSEKSKLYQMGNELIFSFDYSRSHTKFLSINTDDFSKKVSEFEKPILSNTASESLSFQHHNSFFYKGIVYQMKISSKQMKLTAKQFSSKILLKEIVLNKEDSITFKNGPIVQEGAPNPMFSDRVREFEKTSKFLRKVAKGKTGISVFEYDDLLQIEIGSYKEFKGGGAPMMMGGFGGIPIGAIGPISMSFNPTYAAYGSYSSSKSTHIKCVFDKEFNHVKGEPYGNVFDEIDDYEDSLKGNQVLSGSDDNFYSNENEGIAIRLKNVFNHNDRMYFSFLNKKDKQYHIVEFLDKNY